MTSELSQSFSSRWVLAHTWFFTRPVWSEIRYETCSQPQKNIQIRGKDARRSWLHLTFEVPRLPWFITFDIKAYVSGNGGSSRDDDNADVESGVRLLGVVDVDGEVGWGHGHAEAHSFGELILAVPNLTWAVVYHLSRESKFMETLDLT